MNILRNAWSTYGARMIGVAFGWGVGRLAARGVSIPPDVANAAVDLTTAVIGSYVFAHRGASKQINPGDAASGHIAAEEKDWKRELIEEARAAGARVAPMLQYEGIDPDARDAGEPHEDPNAAGGPGAL